MLFAAQPGRGHHEPVIDLNDWRSDNRRSTAPTRKERPIAIGKNRQRSAVIALVSLIAVASLSLSAAGPPAGPVPVLQVGATYHNSVAFAPDANVLACGLKLRDVVSGKVLGAGNLGENIPHCTCVAFSPDGQRLASVHFDRGLTCPTHALCLWSRTRDNQVHRTATLLHAENQPHHYEESLHYLAFSPDGTMLATRLPGDRTVVWDMASGKERLWLDTKGLAVAFTPDGRALTTVTRSGLVQHWDLATGKCLEAAEASRRRDFLFVCLAVASADGKTLAISDHHSVLLKDAQTGNITRRFDDLAGECLALSADGKMLAVGDGGDWVDGDVRLLDTATGKELGRLCKRLEHFHALAFSPDGKFLALGLEQSVEVWDIAELARAGKSRRADPTPPLDASVIPRKGTYRLALGGKTAEEFARQIEPGKPLPASPEVDLILSLRNTSGRKLTMPLEGKLETYLVGEGALNHPKFHYSTGFVVGDHYPKPKQITLAPGESYEVPIRSLDHGFSKQSYWLVPGEYILHVRYSTWVMPSPEGWDILVDPRKGHGTVRAVPLRLRVEAESK